MRLIWRLLCFSWLLLASMDIWKSNDGHYFGHNCPTICLGITGAQGSTSSLERKIQWQLWIGIFLLVNKKASSTFHWNFLHLFYDIGSARNVHFDGKVILYMLSYMYLEEPSNILGLVRSKREQIWHLRQWTRIFQPGRHCHINSINSRTYSYISICIWLNNAPP